MHILHHILYIHILHHIYVSNITSYIHFIYDIVSTHHILHGGPLHLCNTICYILYRPFLTFRPTNINIVNMKEDLNTISK